MSIACPICGSSADPLDSGGKDAKAFRCIRCGEYEITGTAFAMLPSRLAKGDDVYARLSFAVRSASMSKPMIITSANLDELAKQSFPDIGAQLQHLAKWIAGQLTDDSFGRVPNVFPEQLAAIVGAIDGNRVERLLKYAVNEGIIDYDSSDDTFGLTPKGWSASKANTAVEQAVAMTTNKPDQEILRAHCNECGGDRDSFRRAAHTVSDGDGETSWSDTYEVLECCGCHTMVVRHKYWFSEWDYIDSDASGRPRMNPGIQVTYWPPQTTRRKPKWAPLLGDAVLVAVIDEVYKALDAGLPTLASIGTRTLIDRAMFIRVGDAGGFKDRLEKMVISGHASRDEADILEIMTDAGSASAHRGFAPKADTLATIVDTVENFLHRDFILKAEAASVKKATPPRR